MNREWLQKRIQDLNTIRNQHLANANTVFGQIGECEYQLKLLDENTKESAPVANVQNINKKSDKQKASVKQ